MVDYIWNFLIFFSEVKIISGKKITLYWDDYQGHLPDIEYNYREGSATILPTTHSGDSGPKSSMHHDESSLHETGLRLWFEGLIRRSEWAPHMRVTCSRHICSRHCRRTVIRTAFPPNPHPTPTQPQPWNHGPWLEPAGRYKSWGAKALSPICESCGILQICREASLIAFGRRKNRHFIPICCFYVLSSAIWNYVRNKLQYNI